MPNLKKAILNERDDDYRSFEPTHEALDPVAPLQNLAFGLPFLSVPFGFDFQESLSFSSH